MPATIKKKAYGAKKSESEITNVINKAVEFYTGRRKQIIAALSIAAAVVVITAAYSLYNSYGNTQASALLAEAYDLYSPQGAAQADYARAIERYRDVQKSYSGTTSGAIAQYYIGNCLAKLGRSDEALKEYDAFLKRYSGEKLLTGLVHQRMGYIHSALGRQAEAEKSFESAEKSMGPGAATVELARMYERAGNAGESQRKYKEVAEKLAGTSWASEAMGKVQPQAPPAGKQAAQPGISVTPLPKKETSK